MGEVVSTPRTNLPSPAPDGEDHYWCARVPSPAEVEGPSISIFPNGQREQRGSQAEGMTDVRRVLRDHTRSMSGLSSSVADVEGADGSDETSSPPGGEEASSLFPINLRRQQRRSGWEQRRGSGVYSIIAVRASSRNSIRSNRASALCNNNRQSCPRNS